MLKNLNSELRDVTGNMSFNKKLNRCRSFHFRYLELCRAKNLAPLPEIRSKNNATSVLNFFGDKLSVNDWLLIIEALYYDQILQTVSIRMRKNFGTVLELLDTEKKAKLFRQKPVIYTKYVFSGIVEALSNCIEFNKNLKVLNLEGLPLNDKYVESIAKALSSNESIQEISFERSNIGDKGCESLCNTIKYLANIEKLNLSECELTSKGAECVADMIKIQKISRYTEGWQKSLRYCEVDPESLPGLRSIALSRNPQIGDDGLKPILEVLKEDVWIKVIDMENCGLTDRAANLILDCLEINNHIIDLNVNGNPSISKFLLRNIREQLGKEDEDQKLKNSQEELVPGPNGTLIKRKKVTLCALKERLKTLEEQLAFEKVLRKKAETLNEKLNQQIMAYENQLKDNLNAGIPDGITREFNKRNDFQQLAAGIDNINSMPHNLLPTLKKLKYHLNSDETNPTTPANSPRFADKITQLEQRKNLRVRKVKSEIKYMDPLPKNATRDKYKGSKSDHEYANEVDFQLTAVHFETNIGDTIANVVSARSGADSSKTITNQQQFAYKKNKKLNENVGQNNYEYYKKIDLDDLSMPSTRSITSEHHSSDSDTIRNESEPLKSHMRRTKPMPLTPMPQLQEQEPASLFVSNVAKKPDAGKREAIMQSPRSLFMGVCGD